MGNAACHSVSPLSIVELLFIPLNTTSHLQPLAKEIIQVFKLCCQKRFLWSVMSHMADSNSTLTWRGDLCSMRYPGSRQPGTKLALPTLVIFFNLLKTYYNPLCRLKLSAWPWVRSLGKILLNDAINFTVW